MSNKISDDPSPHGLGTEKEDTKDDEQAETFEKREETARGVFDFDEDATVSGKFENPLAGIPKRKLFQDVENFCKKYDMMDKFEMMKKGALISQAPYHAHSIAELDPEDHAVLDHEAKHKWSQPWTLYFLTVMCSLGAATQGMDETCNAGAVAYWPDQLGVSGMPNATYIEGLIVGAPYLACAVLGCWLNEPLNRWFARRGTIWISCFVAAFASIWEAFTYSKWQLFAARFVLGLGIGAKSSTIPVYAAECSPAPIRGALVMQWQVWTAFGIMLGDIMGVAFYSLPEDVAWRFMLGSSCVPPLFVMVQVYFCPESPRWLIQNNKIPKAYKSFLRIRNSELEACRDLFYTYVAVEMERKVNKGKNFLAMLWELFSIPRNRRATAASWIIMFGQQFCGVNVIAYYAVTIFIQSGYTRPQALLFAMGTGILNWVFALPAFFTIDTFGRRFLLLVTFPFLAITLLWTGMSFFIGETDENDNCIGNCTTRTAMITTGMYLYEVFYSPGMGPVPFSYSAEVFPIQVRDVGMASATAVLWAFNFVLSFSWPPLVEAFQPQGAFGWYAAWCIILWILANAFPLVLLFFPETKELTLEELDAVFNVHTHKQMQRGLKEPGYWLQKGVFRRDVELPPLVDIQALRGTREDEHLYGGA
ncbi:MFS sugar transporter [Stemphylium lycopersici]|uniref:MFS sugar transporter n=1 Tax=Stemphylium lycopersici TaxID=183478 RepID=A0A364MS79_STELY|nr:MFS sugar transporter [Stemphylium lycopersici]